MSNEQKLLAKRAKRDAKRKALKQRNAVKKVIATKAKDLLLVDVKQLLNYVMIFLILSYRKIVSRSF